MEPGAHLGTTYRTESRNFKNATSRVHMARRGQQNVNSLKDGDEQENVATDPIDSFALNLFF